MILKWSEGDYVFERTCGAGCPCCFKEHQTHLNLVRNRVREDIIPLTDGIDPPAERPETRYINVRGREEHEAVIRDAALCEELGLDQLYEALVYLKRWGSWLGE